MIEVANRELTQLGRRLRSQFRRFTRLARLLRSRHFRVWGIAAIREPLNAVVESQRSSWLKSDVVVGTHTVRVLAESASKDAQVGRLLAALVRSRGASMVLEFGTNIGLSGSYLASALPDEGRLITIDQSAERQELAAELFALVGVTDRVELIKGTFAETLTRAAGFGFDIAFVDGDHTYDATVWLVDNLVARAAPGAVVVLDDINHSTQMREAWAHLCAKPGLRSLGLTDLGVIEVL